MVECCLDSIWRRAGEVEASDLLQEGGVLAGCDAAIVRTRCLVDKKDIVMLSVRHNSQVVILNNRFDHTDCVKHPRVRDVDLIQHINATRRLADDRCEAGNCNNTKFW